MDRFKRAMAAAVVIVAAASALSACGDSSSEGGSPQDEAVATGKAATGSPIKIGNISPTSGSLAIPSLYPATKAAVRGVNARGGIDGHPIELVHCDDANDANKAAACARKMVSEGVVATVGNDSAVGESQIVPILSKAKIPQIGTLGFANAFQDEYNFLLQGGQVVANAGQIQYASTVGPRIAEVRIKLPITDEYMSFFRDAAAKLGSDIVVDVALPATQADSSAQGATVVNAKPDAVNYNASPQQIAQVSQAATQLGFTGKFLGATNSYTNQDIANLGASLPNFILIDMFPPVSESEKYPAYKTFQSDMKAEDAAGTANVPTSTDFVQDSSVNAWLSVIALQKIAGDAKATTAPEVLKAFKAAKDVDIGLIPPWTPSKQAPGAYPRISNPFAYITKFDGQTLVRAASEPIDTTELLALYK